MSSRGMGSIKKAAKEHKQEFGGGGFLRYFSLKDGESADVVFLGTTTTEPFIAREHGVRQGKNFESVVCRDEKCPACHAVTNGDKRIGRTALRAYWSVYDLRWSRKKKNDEKTREAGQDRYDYEPLDEDSVTERGKAKGIHVRRGKCTLALASQWAQALDGINDTAGRRCGSCGKGKIRVVGYKDKDGKPASKRAGGMDEEELEEAIREGKIAEKLSCDKCDEPVRKSIYNRVVTISRRGAMKSTSYQFTVGEEIDEDVTAELEAEKVEPYDFDDVKAPMSAEGMSNKIGVRNPYGKGKKRGDDDDAEDYDDEDEEDDDDIFDEDEDKPTKGKKKKSKKSSSDDDDSDDDDLDEEEDDEDEVDAPRKKASKKSSKKVRVKVRH